MDIFATLDDESSSDSDGDVIEGRIEVENGDQSDEKEVATSSNQSASGDSSN